MSFSFIPCLLVKIDIQELKSVNYCSALAGLELELWYFSLGRQELTCQQHACASQERGEHVVQSRRQLGVVGWLVGCLTSQQHACASQERGQHVVQSRRQLGVVSLFVGCLTSQQHASVSQRRIYSDNIIVRAATLRQKLKIKLSTSPSHSILTPGRPVPALTL